MNAHADKIERMILICRSLYNKRQQNLHKYIIYQNQNVDDS